MKISSVAAILSALLLPACASILHESKQTVIISSSPEGATLHIDGADYVTPAPVTLRGKSEYFFTIEKTGYKTATGKLDSEFRVWSTVLGNILNLTGLIGIGVDILGTGAAYELEKSNTVTLQPDPDPASLPLQAPVPTPGSPAPVLAPGVPLTR